MPSRIPRLVLALAAVVAVLVTTLVGAPAASAATPTQNAEYSFIPTTSQGARGMLVTGSYVYWVNSRPGGSTVGRANLDGTGVNNNFLTGLTIPSGLATDGTYLYITQMMSETNPDSAIARVKLDGTSMNLAFITGATKPMGIVIAGGKLFWTNYAANRIGTANLDGTGVNHNFILTGSGPYGMATNGTYLYWANYGTDNGTTIGRAAINGTGVNNSFVTGANGPTGVALDANYLYWSNYLGNTVGRAKLDGTSANQSYVTGMVGPVGLAVDSLHLYWAAFDEHRIGRTTFDFTAPALTVPANIRAGQNGTNTTVIYPTPVSATDPDDSSGITVGCSTGTLTGGSFPVGTTTVTCTASDPVGNIATQQFTVTIVPRAYTTITPARLLESRAGLSTVDGQSNNLGLRTAGSTTTLQVTGRAGVPAGIAAAILNVTVTSPTGGGWLTLYPCGTRPNASNLNYAAGQTIANAVVGQLSASGTICIYTSAATHLVVDIGGYVSAGAGYTSLVPARLMDSRAGMTTVDGIGAGIGIRTAGVVTEVQVTGRSGVPANSTLAVVNVTVTGSSSAGYATVYACGDPTPPTSDVNYTAGATVASAALVEIGASGRICVVSSANVHLIVDLNGYTGPTSGYTSVGPARLADSRPGFATTDGQQSGFGFVAAGTTTEIIVLGRAGVPSDAKSATVTLTSTQGSDGYFTVYPCGVSRPNASTFNVTGGATTTNVALTGIGSNGRICVYNSAPTYLIADISGYSY